MEVHNNKKTVKLYIDQTDICEKIRNKDTRLEYIYRYTTENQRDKFIRWTISRNGTKEVAEDIFQDAVIDIYYSIEEGKIVIICEFILSNSIKFQAYFYGILKNKLFTFFRKPGRIVRVEDKHRNNPGLKMNDDIFLEDDSDDQIIIIRYIQENFGETDKKHFQLYFIEELTHSQVVEREDNEIGTNASSRNTKIRLRNKIKEMVQIIWNDDKLLDAIKSTNHYDFYS
jgi:DNA-directed RNA polymerase specialized sigma24 family protein